jgi:competence protein CoiA
MLQGKAASGELVEAAPGGSAVCPGCEARLRPRCGEVNAWHWAHQGGDCDPWHEPETEWHLVWKRRVRTECREVTIGRHRADIRTPNGLVIELQHSFIGAPEIAEREEFYESMLWLFDAKPFMENVFFSTRSSVAPPNVLFDWRHARRTMRSVFAPLFWDLGDGRVVEILQVPRSGQRYGIGRPMHVNEFLATYLRDALLLPAPPPGPLLSAARTTMALQAASELGHSFASSDPERSHECERCHRQLALWIGDPDPEVVDKECVPRDPNEEIDVPF